MSHEIEADYRENWDEERTQCKNCTSYQITEEGGFCNEAKSLVPDNSHCDFFQSID